MPEGRANSSQISYLELVGLINQLLRASLFCALWPDGTWQHSGGSLFHMQNLRPHPRLPESDQICIYNFCSPCILQLKRATSGPGILHCLQIIISGDANVAGPWAEYTLSSKQAEDTQLQKFNFSLNKMRFLLSGSRGCFYFPFLSMGSISARRVLNRMLAPSV